MSMVVCYITNISICVYSVDLLLLQVLAVCCWCEDERGRSCWKASVGDEFFCTEFVSWTNQTRRGLPVSWW